MRRRRILVTGSSGRLGSALVLALEGQHDLVRLDARGPADFTGSITDRDLVARAMDGVDTVIHCAAIPSSRKPYYELIETNVLGTFCLLEEAGNSEGVEQFIYISSVMWHGLSEHPFTNRPLYLPIDEAHPSFANDYYPCTKVQAEYWCEKYVARFRKPAVIVRPPYIVALGEQSTFCARPAPEFPYLNDYIGVSDLVAGIVRAIDYHPEGGIDRFLFHAADQRSTTPSLDLAAQYFPGVPIDHEKLAACEGFGALIDWSHAREKLGWSPEFRCKR